MPLLIASSPDHPSFHVVAPSLPGYAWSEGVRKKGFSAEHYAEVCVITLACITDGFLHLRLSALQQVDDLSGLHGIRNARRRLGPCGEKPTRTESVRGRGTDQHPTLADFDDSIQIWSYARQGIAHEHARVSRPFTRPHRSVKTKPKTGPTLSSSTSHPWRSSNVSSIPYSAPARSKHLRPRRVSLRPAWVTLPCRRQSHKHLATALLIRLLECWHGYTRS